MSDKSESFDEWYGETIWHGMDFKKASVAQRAWNHQQKKIDELRREYKYFASTFNEFFDFMQNYCSEVIYVGNTHQQNAVLVIKDLEEKLQAAEEEIKELQEQGVVDVAIREKLLHENKVLREALGKLAFHEELQQELDLLKEENKKLASAFHQMKLNSKLLLDLVSSLKRSIEINADDAKKWCDEICIKELK